MWDLCSGIGGDAVALAAAHSVIAVDRQPAALWRTMANAEVHQVASRVECVLGDVESCEIPAEALIHIDPDRRGDRTSRANRIEDYSPGLEFLQQLTQRRRGGAIKVGPASNFGGKFPNAELELVSLNGECKEATVWFGELAGSAPYRATVLPSGESLAGHPLSVAAPVAPLGRYLYDPDPAVVRAGLVDLCATQLQLSRLDAAEEYLTGDRTRRFAIRHAVPRAGGTAEQCPGIAQGIAVARSRGDRDHVPSHPARCGGLAATTSTHG